MHLTVDAVTKAYRHVKALDDVTLALEPGQIVAIVGANGAGKTTLLHCLSGIACPTEGRILYDHEPFSRARMDMRRRFFFMPETPFHYQQWTVLQHIGMVLGLYETEGPDVQDRVVSLLEKFEILTRVDSTFHELSRGQKYKAALAALLAVDPEVWMLDEPFASGMDPTGIRVFRDACTDAVGRGRTVIYSTQILEIAEAFSDRVCILSEGRVRAFDGIEQLQSRLDSEGDRSLEKIFEQLHEEAT